MGWAIELRKPKTRVPTPWLWREGNIGDSANRELKAGPGVVREPSTLRNNTHENRETSAASRRKRERSGKAICRNPDLDAVEESDRAVVPMKLPNKEAFAPRRRWWREERGPRRTLWNSTRARHRAGKSVSQGLRGVREVTHPSMPSIPGRSRMR